MKKLFALFLLLTFLAGCEGDSVHRAAARMAATNLDNNMMLNAIESQYGCPTTESVVSTAQRGITEDARTKYNCQGDNNTFTSVNEPREKGFSLIQIIVGIMLVVSHKKWL